MSEKLTWAVDNAGPPEHLTAQVEALLRQWGLPA